MSDDILFLIGFLFVVVLAFTFSNVSPDVKKEAGVFSKATSTLSTNTTRTTSSATKSSSSKSSKPEILSLSRLSPSSGPIGTFVTLYGSNFADSNNIVHFGANSIVADSDGKKIVFKVPALLAQACPSGEQSCVIRNQDTQTSVGKYQVYVSNVNGKSNTLSFEIRNSSSSSVRKPQISNVTGPKQIVPNDTGVWSLVVSVQQPTTLIVSVDWGDSSGQSGTRRISLEKSQTIAFGHTYYASGKYSITFKVLDDDTALSTSYSVPVTVVYAPPVKVLPLALSSLSQSQGIAGTQIVLNGSGFAASPVTIHFGETAVRATPQNYGTNLYFNVPLSTVVGSYPMYVSNDLGQITRTINFRVTNP